MAVIDLIKNKTAKEKAKIKSKEIAKLPNISKHKRKDNYFDGDIEARNITEIDGGIQYFARAWDNLGKPIGFGKDGSVEWERFRVFNPPILVEDPNGIIVRTWVEKDGGKHRDTLKEDPKEALLKDLAHTIKQVGKIGSGVVAGKIGNTVSTFYPDVDRGTRHSSGSSSLGYIWATFINKVTNPGNELDSDTATTISNAWTGSTGTDNWNTLTEPIYIFDTSALPDADTIDSATFSTYGSSKADPTASVPTFNVYKAVTVSNTAIAAGDYNTNEGTAFSTAISYADISVAGYNDWALNATGLLNISATGFSKFCHREAAHVVAASAPTWATWVGNHQYISFSSNETGTTKDPKLVVTHTEASTFVPTVMMF